MAYFLKKANIRQKTYLSIYESFYDSEKKRPANKSYKSFGTIESLQDKGIKDPISYFQKEVDKLNKKRKIEKAKLISDKSPLFYLGYFPLKSILEKLDIKKYVDFFKLTTNFQFDLYELLSSLIYARSVNPCSKHKTYYEVLPRLFESIDYSYNQLLSGLEFIGNDYEKFVEIFTAQTKKIFGIETDKTYFDCTNFYFEIDRENDFQRTGPSKENQHSPIVGLGLLLDKNQIPIAMKMYPGNASEKPVLRDVINLLKQQNNVTGKTIHVADKGLNCAQNIYFSRKNGDGYLFSKTVKGLSAKEKVWVLLDQDFKEVRDNKGKVVYRYKSCIDEFPYTFEHEGKQVTVSLREKRLLTYNPTLAAKKKYEINKMVEKALSLSLSQAKRSEYGETGKYVNFTDAKGKKASVSINQKAIEKDLLFAGYNLLVTSELNMQDNDIYATYHNLWRIEESFRIMKSDLDARPAFVQKQETIQGHFLICYLTVLLERLFQFKILNNEYSSSAIFKFIKSFKVVKNDKSYINTMTSSDFNRELATILDLPILHYNLSNPQIKSILNCKMKYRKN